MNSECVVWLFWWCGLREGGCGGGKCWVRFPWVHPAMWRTHTFSPIRLALFSTLPRRVVGYCDGFLREGVWRNWDRDDNNRGDGLSSKLSIFRDSMNEEMKSNIT